jgi:small-conductance mechanosensitive channel
MLESLGWREARERLLEVSRRLAAGDPWWAFAFAAAATIVAAVFWLLLQGLFRRLAQRVESWRGTLLRPLKFQDQEILSEAETTQLVLGAVRAVRGVSLVALLYAYASFVLRLFSVTRGVADALVGYVIAAARTVGVAIVDYLPNLFFLIALFLVGKYALRFARVVFDGIAVGRVRIAGFHADWAAPTFKIVRFLAVIFLVVVGFPYLPGHESPAFQAVSIFLGVLLSLGSTGAVANVVSGIVLTYTRAFQIGDRVQIADAIGDVVEKTMFVTRIRTPKNVDVTIPNAEVLGHHIMNFSTQAATGGLIVHTEVTIGYDAAWQQVETLLLAAAGETDGLLAEPAPFVLQTALDDFYVHYELNAYTREAKRLPSIYSALHRAIQERFHTAGVEIASPHLGALRDGNAPNIPADKLPAGRRGGAFRLLHLPNLPGGKS